MALATFLSLMACAVASPLAGAVVTQEEELGRFGTPGSGSGQLGAPWGVATDEESGEVFVVDSNNERISVFDAWGEFRRAWGWGVASGADALETCTAGCGPGTYGSGPGQLNVPSGITVDGQHNVFVFEYGNARVQKFSPTGEFLLMFGGEVNKTTNANVCTAASDDECGAGVKGSDPGFFSLAFAGTYISHDASGSILVGGEERIQRFDSEGNYLGEINGGVFAGNAVECLAVDQSSGDIYAVLRNKENVYRLDETGALLGELKVARPRDIAVGPDGTVFVIEAKGQQDNTPQRIVQFDATGAQVGELERSDGQVGETDLVLLKALGTNSVGDLYVGRADVGVSDISFFGPPPFEYGDPPKVPPTISAQFASHIDTDSAELGAQINPRYWADSSYYVEYGTGSCAAGECDSTLPLPPGNEIGRPTKQPVSVAPVHLPGLAPQSTYHYRFVAQSGGGGPVYGVDPDGSGPEEASFEEGLEGTFTTFPVAAAPEPCANDAFRTGMAFLPDCRAYEMVSPPDKADGDIFAPVDITGFETRLEQSSLDGERLTYSSYRAFAGSKGSPYISQYIASRTPGGWATETLQEPRGPSFYVAPAATENEFKAFSPDLCQAWLRREAEPQLAPGAVPGYPGFYRRDNCGGSYEALSTVEPTLSPDAFQPDLQGVSGDGSTAIFRVNDKLSEDATAGKYQVYEARGGELRLVCILPDGTPYPGDCSAGTAGAFPERAAAVANAISEDGSRIYWSTTSGESPGTIYLRLDGTTTVPVSGKATSAEARFWAADPEGSEALFTVEDQSKPITVLNHNLYRYDLAGETTTKLAGKVVGIAATSEDLSRVYFISEEAIGGEGTAGAANLYLSHEGTTAFIATLSEEDARFRAFPSNATPEPVFHAAQATPDGNHLAFISNRPLTGFDNTDAVSGKPDSEVFTYAADTDTLDCASCNPVAVRPSGRNIQAPGNSGFLWTAASLPLGHNQLYTPRAISADGSRLFFTAYADLLPSDANGAADVYEWERPGAGSCDEADADYFSTNGGCLYLISTGQSPQDSELVDISADAQDVFISTKQSLLPQDPGLIDVYDVREGGGFQPPPPLPLPCVGEVCQDQAPVPAFQAPGSNAPRAGNPPHKPRCPKGKHRAGKGGKGKCVKNKKGKGRDNKQRKPGKGGRAAR
ncbi:MAG TPA: NHL repeat-containing protein [Solirubrobacterales bacterium]|nr:NHL repeat-containing protein [Solirubrobacterales bacterium]